MITLKLIIIFLLGYVVINRLLIPKKSMQNMISYRFLVLVLSLMMGLGINSILEFLALLLRLTWNQVLIGQIIILIGLFLIIFKKSFLHIRFKKPRISFSNWLLGFISLIFVVWLGALMFNSLSFSPHGGIDAWAMVNFKARAIIRNPVYWTDFFSTHAAPWSHMDYPLFLPTSVVSLWRVVGSETQLVPMILALTFYLCLLLFVVTMLTLSQSIRAGLFALLLIGSNQFFFLHSGSLFADLPLVVFITIALGLWLLQDVFKRQSLMVLIMLFSGLAAWTKNEGMLFYAIMTGFFSYYMKIVRVKPFTIMTVLAISLFPVLLFKILFPIQNDVVTIANSGLFFSNLIDIERHRVIIYSFVSEFVTFFDGNVYVALSLIVLFWLGLLRTRLPYRRSYVLILFCQLAGYYGAYLWTPYNVSEHMDTSLLRLLYQLMPAIILLTSMMIDRYLSDRMKLFFPTRGQN